MLVICKPFFIVCIINCKPLSERLRPSCRINSWVGCRILVSGSNRPLQPHRSETAGITTLLINLQLAKISLKYWKKELWIVLNYFAINKKKKMIKNKGTISLAKLRKEYHIFNPEFMLKEEQIRRSKINLECYKQKWAAMSIIKLLVRY